MTNNHIARAHEMGLLTDLDLRLDRDPELVRLKLDCLHSASCLGQLVESRPLLPVRRHPLALIGADHADPDRLRVLHAARLADPHGSVGWWRRESIVTGCSASKSPRPGPGCAGAVRFRGGPSAALWGPAGSSVVVRASPGCLGSRDRFRSRGASNWTIALDDPIATS